MDFVVISQPVLLLQTFDLGAEFYQTVLEVLILFIVFGPKYDRLALVVS